MMAHEPPIPIHQEAPSYDALPKNRKKTSKAKGQSQNQQHQNLLKPPIRLLPNGEAVDFGRNNKKSTKANQNQYQSSKISDPSLPDGSTPNFKPAEGKLKGKKGKQQEQSLPNGSKPNFKPGNTLNNDNQNNTLDKSKKNLKLASKSKSPTEDTYAGSSFHSSPAALNLPKPSFKSTSPKADQAVGSTTATAIRSPLLHAAASPAQVPVGVVPHFSPGQGPHPNPNLTYPVTLYGRPAFPSVIPMPVTQPVIHAGNQFVQNGFSYQHTPQGNINYQFAPGGQYPAPFPPQQFQQIPQQVPAPQMHPQIHPSMVPAVQVQQLSFNDHVGPSAK